MRFTSLVVELIRARPRLVVVIVVLCQAMMWLGTAVLFYRSPPGQLATAIAFGREYQVGTDLGPPLSFWLADIAYRVAGNHLFGVYVLAALCSALSLWVIYLLARTIVGGQQAVLAVLLTMTITAFGAPTLEFGPEVLARPLWALLLLHSWRILGQGRRNAWFAWSIEAGLLLLTTPAAAGLLLLLAGFVVSTAQGRRVLRSFDPLFALLVVLALALPYLIFVLRSDSVGLPALPMLAELSTRAWHWLALAGGILLALSAVVLLVLLDASWINRSETDAPIIYRRAVPALARDFVYCFAIAPVLAGSLISGLFGLPTVFGGAAVTLSMVGLALVVASGDLIYLRRQRLLRMVWAAAVAAPAVLVAGSAVVLPLVGDREVATAMPARDISRFFVESFERRTNQRLQAVAGDPQLASLVALGRRRAHLFLDATPQRTPWMTAAKFAENGGIVVWRASDTAGTPPPELVQRFPGLVPEVPRSFDWLINGRQPVLRIGWAIVRPKGT
ncbi:MULTISPECIES: glycosyltransferase family 39 protein [unclassified Bradyrhizobium]|uniref:glycosyltransferase family 39 protein n=1 Tax=unclassified Bradyrhizobium TaxID=2631580 RepID=UPI0028EF7A04|nr:MULTISPECIES: glycosyltransferase family 39 protein [unclassified Bradyrhizobium]